MISFQKDDTVRHEGSEYRIENIAAGYLIVFVNSDLKGLHPADCELAYRPASRLETEVLRRVAKAAERHHEARVAWANAAIVDNVYGELCEEVAAASDKLVEALDAWKEATSDTAD